MDCNRIIEKEVSEEIFNSEITKAVQCIAKCLDLKETDFREVTNENISGSINGRKYSKLVRKLIEYKKNNEKLGLLECYLSIESNFIEIFHN